MSTIDKQRIAAVIKHEQLGYTFAAGETMDGSSNLCRFGVTLLCSLP
jgi:hypothetical protein